MSRRQRERVALIVAALLWEVLWPVGYLFSGDAEFLYMPTCVLVCTAAVLWSAWLVTEWIEKGDNQ